MLDVQARAYNEQYGTNFINVIPCNIYGLNDNYNLERGHILPSLIHKCYLAKRDKTDFVVWGSGNPIREFLFANDAAEICLWILKNYNEQSPIIISPSVEISVAYVANVIANLMNFKGEIVYDKTKPDGQFKKPSDNSKLMKLIPDYKFTPIEIGIEKTIKWFVKNYETVRK